MDLHQRAAQFRAKRGMHGFDRRAEINERYPAARKVQTVQRHLHQRATGNVRRRRAFDHLARHTLRARQAVQAEAAVQCPERGRALPKRSTMHLDKRAPANRALRRSHPSNHRVVDVLEDDPTGTEVLTVDAHLNCHVAGHVSRAGSAFEQRVGEPPRRNRATVCRGGKSTN